MCVCFGSRDVWVAVFLWRWKRKMAPGRDSLVGRNLREGESDLIRLGR